MFGYPLTFAGSSVVQSETLFVLDVLQLKINGQFCGQNRALVKPVMVNIRDGQNCQNVSRHLVSQQTELNRRNERELCMPCKNNGA